MYLNFLTFLLIVGLTAYAEDERPCTREGLQCKNCSIIASCHINDDGNGFHYINEKICPFGAVCDDLFFFCERHGFCRYKKFECQNKNYEDEVIFPDPYSCVEYHGCQLSEQFDYVCDEGKGFNPVTRNCSLDLNDTACTDAPLPICEDATSPIPISRTIYEYQCVKETETIPLIYPVIRLKGESYIKSEKPNFVSTD